MVSSFFFNMNFCVSIKVEYLRNTRIKYIGTNCMPMFVKQIFFLFNYNSLIPIRIISNFRNNIPIHYYDCIENEWKMFFIVVIQLANIIHKFYLKS